MKYIKIILHAYFIIALLASSLWAQYGDRFSNLSSRAQVGTGSNVVITGFVIQEGAPKKVLLRAVGPSLSPFGITGALSDPQLQLFNNENLMILSNDNWSSADQSVQSGVGAFSLPINSKDSVVVATLAPGAYTAMVKSVTSTGTGVALLEIYELDGSNRLMNLSTRANVGTGGNTLISGLSVSKSQGARKVLIRAVGPTLTEFGVSGALVDPTISIADSSGRQIAGNDNWYTNDNKTLTDAFTKAGAFSLMPNSKDSALLLDLMPGNYTILVNGVANTSGVALVELYDLSPETISTVSLKQIVPATDTLNKNPMIFSFDRVGPTDKEINVKFNIGGTAVSGVDYEPIKNFVIIPAGVSSVELKIIPKSNGPDTNNKTIFLSLITDYTYGIGSENQTFGTIHANSGKLFVSMLRPSGNSTAYGTAIVQLSSDEKSAYVSVNFSNLSSSQVVGHLQIGKDYIYTLPQGQVNSAYWSLSPVGKYSYSDILSALKSGRVGVSIDSAFYPEGELIGSFIIHNPAEVVNSLNTPTSLPSMEIISDIDAARFLAQATFGPTKKDIEELRKMGYSSWLSKQVSITPSSHYKETWDDFNRNRTVGGTGTRSSNGAYQYPGVHRQVAWWHITVNKEDQLRQRVAFALSQIFVISDYSAPVDGSQEGMANYYDIFVNHGFGNFRTILEEVTMSPMMGLYLSSLRNSKSINNTTPDENYARELMQLFTIGLYELNSDGTLRLNSQGHPINTYTQDTVVQTAKVFTGLSFNNSTADAANNVSLFRGSPADYINKMMLWPAFHDDTQKTIIGGKILPSSQGGIKDIKDTLDALFNHPNTPPFISRQLIQKLVTSNPSPSYIYRVSKVFENNGSGVRGDMYSVVRAVLMDVEARSFELSQRPTYGKVKEPIIKATALFRAFEGGSNYYNRIYIPSPQDHLAQAPLRSPTVFNFFEPNYTLPGPIAEAGLYSPEFQIFTDTTAITQPNFYYTYIYNNRSTTDMTQQTVGLNLTNWIPLAKTPQFLVEEISLLLTSGTMNKQNIDRIVSAVNSIPTGNTINDTERVRSAIYLVITSPQGSIQK